MTPPIEPAPGGCRLTLHVQPRATRTELVGLHGAALKIRVAAPPVDGAANLELLRFLAKSLGVPRAGLQLTAGAAARGKTVLIRGMSVEAVARKLGLTP